MFACSNSFTASSSSSRRDSVGSLHRSTTSLVDEIRDWLEENRRGRWKRDLTGVYIAATYKMLKQNRKAQEILANTAVGDPQEADYGHFYDGLLRDSGYIYLIAKHFPQKLAEIGKKEIEELVSKLKHGRFNSLSGRYYFLGQQRRLSSGRRSRSGRSAYCRASRSRRILGALA